MGPKPQPAPKLSFGPFEFDPVSGDLYKSGLRIRLQGKPLQILCLLVDHAGEVVSRDDLRAHLWPDTAFVDFEQGLNAAVNKLRQALGDAAATPRYVETIPGRGYRFIAHLQHGAPPRPVLEMALPAQPAARLDAEPPKSPWARWSRPAWLAVLVLAAAAAAGLVGFRAGTQRTSRTPPRESHSVRFAVTPPEGYALESAGPRQSFALSPDGAHLAFLARGRSGSFSTFLRDLDSVETRQLPATEGSHTLFWSSDSQTLYIAIRGKLRRVPRAGGPGVEICDLPAYMHYGTELPGGDLLLSGRRGTIFVPAAGGAVRQVEDRYAWPQPIALSGSPPLLLQSRWTPGESRRGVQISPLGDAASAAGKRILDVDSHAVYAPSTFGGDIGYLLYLRAGTLVAHPFDVRNRKTAGESVPIVERVAAFQPVGSADFSVSQTGVLAYQSVSGNSQLAWVDRAGRTVSIVGPGSVSLKSARLSPDGRLLATALYDVARGAQTIWLIDLQSDSARMLTSGEALLDAPVWAPDSRRLVYLRSVQGGAPDLGFRGVEANDQEQILHSDTMKLPTDWSPDGRFVLFSNTGYPRYANETQGDVWIADAAAPASGAAIRPLLQSPFHESNATFSPDGKWLAFTSDESGRPELYVQAFDAPGGTPRVTGERILVSQNGAQAVRWRRDGKELFFLDFEGQIHAVPVQAGAKPRFGKPVELFALSLEAASAIHSVIGFDVTPDGERFVIPVASRNETASIVVIQNWEAGLSSKAARKQ